MNPSKTIGLLIAILVVTITQGDFGVNKWCGWSFFSGKIMINTNPICDYETTLKHELKHTFYWNLPKAIQISYCDSYDLKYNRECWEMFANEI